MAYSNDNYDIIRTTKLSNFRGNVLPYNQKITISRNGLVNVQFYKTRFSQRSCKADLMPLELEMKRFAVDKVCDLEYWRSIVRTVQSYTQPLQLPAIRLSSSYVRSCINSYLKSHNTDYDPVVISNEVPKVKRSDNVKRSVDMVYDIVRNNSFCTFLTLTLNGEGLHRDVTDIDVAREYLHYFVDNIRKKVSDFKYICVMERTKTNILHFHLLCDLPCGSDLIPHKPIRRQRRKSKEGYQIIEYPEIYGWNLGHGIEKILSDGSSVSVGTPLFDTDLEWPCNEVNFGFVQAEPCKPSDTSKYLTKELTGYMTKSLDGFFDRRVVTSSRNCLRSFVVHNYISEELMNHFNVNRLAVGSNGDVLSYNLLCHEGSYCHVEYLNRYDKTPIYCFKFIPINIGTYLINLREFFDQRYKYSINNIIDDYLSSGWSGLPVPSIKA